MFHVQVLIKITRDQGDQGDQGWPTRANRPTRAATRRATPGQCYYCGEGATSWPTVYIDVNCNATPANDSATSPSFVCNRSMATKTQPNIMSHPIEAILTCIPYRQATALTSCVLMTTMICLLKYIIVQRLNVKYSMLAFTIIIGILIQVNNCIAVLVLDGPVLIIDPIDDTGTK